MRFDVYLTYEDKPYLSFLKMLLGHHQLCVYYDVPPTISGALVSSESILVCNPAFIKKMTFKNKCNLEDYYGSFWLRKDIKGRDVPILCLPPLKRLVSTKPGVFLARRYLSKILTPPKWFSPSHFSFTLCDDLLSYSDAFNQLINCHYIAVDIETSPAYLNIEERTDPQHIITCVGYCGITFDGDGNRFTTDTYVIPCRSMESYKWIRKINSLPQPKIFQNGKYDDLYFLRFGAPVRNWIFDTLDMHHCIYAEFPKNLGYIAAFYLREVSYWKDEGQTGNLYDLYKYNAKDAHATANVFLSQIQEAPDWAIKNYLIKWKLIYPCLACEVDGLSVDPKRLENVRKEQTEIQSKALSSIEKKLGKPGFNPSSPKQVLQLLHLLGNKSLSSSDVKALEIAADNHPLARRIIDEITEYRRSTKLITTYINAELWPPRGDRQKLLFTLNPSGTDTGRLASKESALWCGTQLQNIPPYFKQTIKAEEGFLLGEGDFSQSESRCTAYCSGDTNLIAAVESKDDFHAKNASAFFGLSYEDIIEEERKAKILPIKPFTLRDLAKRVNHGANYNMGEAVLLSTMGIKNVLRAKTLLGLSEKLTPKEVCKHLLQTFSDTYPKVKGEWYESIIASVKLTKRLTSALGWTRLCFGTPWNSKPDLNAYCAHVPQNLSAGILNEAFSDIFWQIHITSNGDFRLKGNVHDSIIFSYRKGRLDLVEKVVRLMTRPTPVTDCFGITRTMTIPVAMKAEAEYWSELKPISFEGTEK